MLGGGFWGGRGGSVLVAVGALNSRGRVMGVWSDEWDWGVGGGG